MPEPIINLIILVITIVAAIIVDKLTPIIQEALGNKLVRCA